MTRDEARRRLVEAGRILEAQGQGDMTRGHVSARVPGRPGYFLMKPHSVGFAEITADNLLTIDPDGEVAEGAGRRHGEVFIHGEIYRARPDVGAVVHTHPTHAVALSVTGRPLRPLCQGGALFAGERLPVFAETMDLISTPALGRAVAAALGPHRAVLLRAHGVVVAGATLEEAVVSLVMLEEAARLQLLAEAAGSAVSEFPADDVARLRDRLAAPEQFVLNFDFLAREAARARGT